MIKYITLWKAGFSVFMLIICSMAQAATLEVCRSGCVYASIQDAIRAADAGDTVLVHNGIYRENIYFGGKAITIKSKNGASETWIRSRGGGSVIYFISGEGNDSVLDGFTITRGTGVDSWGYRSMLGGGIYCDNASSPSIINCIIRNNRVRSFGRGGGMFCAEGSAPYIANCTIRNNTSGEGGGIYSESSSPTLINCIIRNNIAFDGSGGGISCRFNPSLIMDNCDILYNRAEYGGGGLRLYGGSASITNCIIAYNKAGYGGGIEDAYSEMSLLNCVINNNWAFRYEGGAIWGGFSERIINNCTIINNRARGSGGGIACVRNSNTIVNSILWGNVSIKSDPQIFLEGSDASISISYSDIQGGWTGTGNIDTDPQFLDKRDYHLSSTSPCIDTGTDSGAPSTDIEGLFRPQDGNQDSLFEYDIGAVEYVSE